MKPAGRSPWTASYDEAIKVLALAADKTDPRILNYLGYSHRKAGRVLVGLGYYQEALRNDPDYTLVREYMGEAHLHARRRRRRAGATLRNRKALRQGLPRIWHAGAPDRGLSEGLRAEALGSRAGQSAR